MARPPAVARAGGRLVRSLAVRAGVELDAAGQLGTLDAEAWRRLVARRTTTSAIERPVPRAAWHEDCARDAEAAGDGFAARWHLDRLIAARPDDGLLHARRAVARLRERGDADGGSADLDRALELGPRDRIVDWLAHRAEDLRLSGRADGALLLLDRAVAARPDDWRLHAIRAEALGALGRRDEHDAARPAPSTSAPTSPG